MIRVRWPIDTVRQVHTIVAYIRRHDPQAADDRALHLFASGNSLTIFPHHGRPTDSGLRQMTGVPPHVLTYEVTDEDVVAVRVGHGRGRSYARRR